MLLQRKQLIIERIKELSGGRKIQSLQELIDQVSDETVRNQLSKELETLIQHNQDLTEKAKAAAQEAEQLRERDLREVREQILRIGSGIFLVHGHDEVLKLEVARLLENVTEEEITILAEQTNRGKHSAFWPRAIAGGIAGVAERVARSARRVVLLTEGRL